MMEKEKMDRRVRKTKSLLLQCLLQLMEEKDVKDISVKELADLADINRGTFYLHYSDIYDMLSKVEDELFVEFENILGRTMKCELKAISPRDTLLDIFSFVNRHRDVVRVMVGPHGDLSFVNRLKDTVKEHISRLLEPGRSAYYYAYVESFNVSGCAGVVETWLTEPFPPTPEEMSLLCSSMLEKGLSLLQEPQG